MSDEEVLAVSQGLDAKFFFAYFMTDGLVENDPAHLNRSAFMLKLFRKAEATGVPFQELLYAKCPDEIARKNAMTAYEKVQLVV